MLFIEVVDAYKLNVRRHITFKCALLRYSTVGVTVLVTVTTIPTIIIANIELPFKANIVDHAPLFAKQLRLGASSPEKPALPTKRLRLKNNNGDYGSKSAEQRVEKTAQRVQCRGTIAFIPWEPW